MGDWSISESTTPATLTISYVEDGATTTEEWKITELTSNKMVLTIEDLPIVGTLEITFEKD